MKRKKPNSAFESETLRLRYMNALHKESLTLLAMLYGLKFDNGDVKISDFYKMTMGDIHRELQLRTLIINWRKVHKSKKLKEEKERQEKKMLEQLKALNGD